MKNTDSSSSMGFAMIVVACLLFLALLTVGFNNYLEQQNNPNQDIATKWSDNSAEVTLKRNRYGHYLVTGLINNSPVTFLVDTGATLISIPEELASRLQLKKGFPRQSRTANGSITVYDTRLNSVAIGAIELKNIRASINPHMHGDEVLLGMSFIKHLEITQKGDQLTLRL